MVLLNKIASKAGVWCSFSTDGVENEKPKENTNSPPQKKPIYIANIRMRIINRKIIFRSAELVLSFVSNI